MKFLRIPMTLAVVAAITAACGSTGAGSSGASAAGETPASSVAADYPNRTVEYVVPSSAGGGNDTTARLIADLMEQYGIVPVDVDIRVTNRPGGSTAVGMAYVKENADNDHLIMNVTTSIVTTPLLDQAEMSYTDFTPIAMVASDKKVLVVNSDSPYESIEDLVAADPETVTQGGGGVATAEAIAGFKLEEHYDVDWTYVSFDGGAEGLTAVLGNQVTFAIPGALEIQQHVEAGRLRVLATTAPERLDEYPDVPTFLELGITDLPEAGRGIVGPPDMPAEAVAYWEDAIRQVTETEEWQEYLVEGDLNDRFLTSDEYAQWLSDLHDQYVELIPAMGL